jgi:lactoylglutathione lyase
VRVEHIGLWARDLERLRDFYVEQIGGESGPLYENARTGFRSYFVSFGDGARLELMSRPLDQAAAPAGADGFGYAHVAFRLDSRAAVDAAVNRLEASGAVVLSRPRVTGDGYYEALLADPEGNRIELVGP